MGSMITQVTAHSAHADAPSRLRPPDPKSWSLDRGTTSPPRQFFGTLDSLRGVAALLVVLYHLPPWRDGLFDLQVIRHSYLMVNFFFVLSGFVLFHSYANRISSGTGFVKFVALRLSRLYPVHLLFVLPFAVIELAKYVAFRRYGMVGTSAIAPSIGNIVYTFLANVFLVQGLGITSNRTPFNFPNGSISTEFYTYLVFAVGVLALSKRGFKVMSVVVALGSCALLMIFGDVLGDTNNFLRCLSGFFIGCLTRAAYGRLQGTTLRGDWPMLMLGLVIGGLALPWQSPVAGANWCEELALPIAVGLILTLLLTPSSKLNLLLLSKPLRWLGEVSYSLYMSHALVQWAARQVLKRYESPSLVGETVRAHLSPGVAWVAYPAVMIATLLVAWVSYLTVEAPLRDAGRRRITSWMERQSSVERMPRATPKPSSALVSGPR